MLFRKRAVALAAAAVLACAPAAAQKISDLPAASTLTGNEKVPAIQGTGCATHVAPCSNVALTATQLATLASASSQPLDADLTSLAAQTTAANRCQYWSGSATAALYDCTGFVRGLGTSADAAGFRSAIGLGTLATQSGTFSGTSSGTNTGDQTRVGLGAAASGTNSDITALTGLTTALPIGEGGTGATTTAAARTALGVTQTLVFASGASFPVTGTTAETNAANITIPANAIGPNGQVEIEFLGTATNNANSKTFRVKFGGTTFYTLVASTDASDQPHIRISNRGTGSQIAFPGSVAVGLGKGGSATPTTSSVDTTAASSLTITVQLATSTDTVTLESYLIRVTYGA